VNKAIKDFNKKVDVVVQNPPFGTKRKHADKEFLAKAFSIAGLVYTIHKSATQRFVEAVAQDYGFSVTNKLPFQLMLPATQKFHRRRMHRIPVFCYRLERNV